MGSVYPNGYIAELPQRIIEARGRVLMSLMPSGVSGGGSDGWWESYTEHTNEDGTTWKHWAGSRYVASATAEEFSVTMDTDARTVTVRFAVNVTKECTGQTYDNSNCKACNPPTSS